MKNLDRLMLAAAALVGILVGSLWTPGVMAQQPTQICDGIDCVNVTTSNSLEVVGDFTNNATAAGANLLPVAGAIATASAPSLTEGRVVTLSTDLSGAVRVTGSSGTTQYNEDTASTDAESVVMVGFRRCDTASTSSATDGDRVTACLDSFGRVRTIATLENGATTDTDDDSVTAGQTGAAIIIASQYNTASVFGTSATPRTAGVKVGALATRTGIPFTLDGSPDEITETVTVTDSDGAQTGTAIVSVSTGSKIVMTYLSVKCSGSNTVNPDVRVAFDTDGTFASASTTGTVGHIDGMDDIPPGGGFTRTKPAAGADDEDLRYSLSDPVGGSCTLTVSYFTIAS